VRLKLCKTSKKFYKIDIYHNPSREGELSTIKDIQKYYQDTLTYHKSSMKYCTI